MDLRREEGLERLLPLLGREPGPVVVDLDPDGRLPVVRAVRTADADAGGSVVGCKAVFRECGEDLFGEKWAAGAEGAGAFVLSGHPGAPALAAPLRVAPGRPPHPGQLAGDRTEA